VSPRALPASPMAIGFSLALHAAAVAGTLALAWQEPARPLPMIPVSLVFADPAAPAGAQKAGDAPPAAPEAPPALVSEPTPAPEPLAAPIPKPAPESEPVSETPPEPAPPPPVETAEASPPAAPETPAVPPARDEAAPVPPPPPVKPAHERPRAPAVVAATITPRPAPTPHARPAPEPEAVAAPAPPPEPVIAARDFDPGKRPPGAAAPQTVEPQAATAVLASARPDGIGSAAPALDTGLGPGDSALASAFPGNPRPAYPFAARRKGIEGRVVLRVSVLASGGVASVAVERTSGSKLLDRAALDAVRRWRFSPATRLGQPVVSTVRVPITFRLDR